LDYVLDEEDENSIKVFERLTSEEQDKLVEKFVDEWDIVKIL